MYPTAFFQNKIEDLGIRILNYSSKYLSGFTRIFQDCFGFTRLARTQILLFLLEDFNFMSSSSKERYRLFSSAFFIHESSVFDVFH
jgi:hypothetical protein